MHLIFCVDAHDGLSFCGRRLSRDREVANHILHLAAGSNLWIHPYSASLFPDSGVQVDADYLNKADEEDYCFVEKGSFPQMWNKVKSVTLYHWNRTYPSTEKFPRSLLAALTLVAAEEFPGHSHEKITVERYIP